MSPKASNHNPLEVPEYQPQKPGRWSNLKTLAQGPCLSIAGPDQNSRFPLLAPPNVRFRGPTRTLEWHGLVDESIPYCTIGYRSGQYTRPQSRDWIMVRNLAGGRWSAGRSAVAPEPLVQRARQRRTRLHVYGAAWDLAPRAYETQRFDG